MKKVVVCLLVTLLLFSSFSFATSAAEYTHSFKRGTYTFSTYFSYDWPKVYQSWDFPDGSAAIVVDGVTYQLDQVQISWIDGNTFIYYDDYLGTVPDGSYTVYIYEDIAAICNFSESENDNVPFEDLLSNCYVYDSSSLPGDTVFTNIGITFMSVFLWIGSVLVNIVSLFWSDGSLTLFGICSIVALGISLFLLLVSKISDFLQFRS